MGGWIEKGASGVPAPLDAFRLEGNGLTEYVLKNLYIYFWRWATWKVFASIPEDQSGVICFISTAGYLRGPGFRGMREYLRREADEGWIIDLTPEGQTPSTCLLESSRGCVNRSLSDFSCVPRRITTALQPKFTTFPALHAQELYDAGNYTVQQIADLLKTPRSTIYGHLNKESIGRKPQPA